MNIGHTVREHTIAAVQASGLPFHVVEAAHTAHIDQPGMGDSIATGVRACAQAAGWLVLPADLPLVQPTTLRAVAQALANHVVVQAVYQGQRGHPVGFAATCGPELMALSGDQGAGGDRLRLTQGLRAATLGVSTLGCATFGNH